MKLNLLFSFILLLIYHHAIQTSSASASQATSASTSTNNNVNLNVQLAPQSQQQQQQQTAGSPFNGQGPSVITQKSKYRTLYACEDTLLTIDCDYGSKIDLVRANFGRFSIEKCNEQASVDLATDCLSPSTLRLMNEKCDGKQRCTVNATSAIFGDRCPTTRKYLEVNYMCEPEKKSLPASSLYQSLSQSSSVYELPTSRVDLRNLSSIPSSNPIYNPGTSGTSSILPPNNPITHRYSSSLSPMHPSSSNSSPGLNFEDGTSNYQQAVTNLQPQQAAPAQQSNSVMNSDVITFNSDLLVSSNQMPLIGSNNQVPQIVVALRHKYFVDDRSNLRCLLWDPLAKGWTEKGGQILKTNMTHTVCAFNQASSYLLVMDFLEPQQNPSMISSSSSNDYTNVAQQTNNDRGQQQISALSSGQTVDLPQRQLPSAIIQPSNADYGSPLPGILDSRPRALDELRPQLPSRESIGQPQQQYNQQNVHLSSFGYMMTFSLIAVVVIIVIFIASNMRSAAGATLKNLGSFSAFTGGGPSKLKGRRNDDLNGVANKDLLVINNKNGHQFLYAPANTTKIPNSGGSTTHIIPAAGTLASHHHHHQTNTLHHQMQQQQFYSGNGTLSNLSTTGAQSNNYYYGLMNFNPLVPQHQLSGQQQQQQPQLGAGQAQTMHRIPSYQHQANRSTISQESANSTPSSSGVESGSTSVQQQQQQQQQQQARGQQPPQAQSCLILKNTDYNLMAQLAAYGTTSAAHHQTQLMHQQQAQQPQLTMNAHYSSSGGRPLDLMSSPCGQQPAPSQRWLTVSGHGMREHIYECVDDEQQKLHAARGIL